MTDGTVAASPQGDALGTRGVVAVGVDDSDTARAALRWAAAEAQLRAARLDVVLAWSVMTVPSPPTEPGTIASITEYEAQVEGELRALVGETLGDQVPGDLVCRPVHAGPVSALLAAAEESDLLVVGSRGRGGFAGLVLGSVSSQVVQHARCPVVVVHPPRSESD